MQGLCLSRFPARHLSQTLITTSIALKNIIPSTSSRGSRLVIRMSTNEPKNSPLDEAEAAAIAAGEKWGPQRITRGRRDVVTAFVRRRSTSSLGEEGESILLVKRSEKVNTYKLHWGGVSGVVEGDENLQQRAEQEVS
jgi:predicted Ser/Thr protein kinase